jgi:hypothetical protein
MQLEGQKSALIDFSEKYNIAGEAPIPPRRNYVEVIARKAKKGKNAGPEQQMCSHLTSAIHTDGLEKGRLVRVCVDRCQSGTKLR